MQIEFTNEYDTFSMINENRPVSAVHVRMLMDDPEFPKTLKYHPIIVDEKRRIIDGQHRFCAAKKLGMPIWYITQKGANLDTIRRYNVQQKCWTPSNYLAFFCKQGKQDYIFIETACRAYRWNLGAMLDICNHIGGYPKEKLRHDFQNGEFQVKEKKSISEFLEKFEQGYEKLRAFHEPQEYRHIFTKSYVQAFCQLYRDDEKAFDKLMTKLHLVYNSMPMTNKSIDAQLFLQKALQKKARYA